MSSPEFLWHTVSLLQAATCVFQDGTEYNVKEVNGGDSIHSLLSVLDVLTVGWKDLKYYRKTSSISRTKSQNLKVSCLLLQWSLPNPLKPGVKLRMKM